MISVHTWHSRRRFVPALIAGLLICPLAAPEPLSYNRDIRPIISKNCFTCHGPDGAARKADLRLDERDVAIGSKAIVPGDVAASELVSRILTEDPDDLMPPPESKLSLTAAQKETLKQWIAEGAEYEKHWAFIPPVAPPIPTSEGLMPIDALVQAKLAAAELTPAPEASKEALIRRVAFDLTGLPPTLAEIDAFLADSAPDAYARMVDSYLGRPAHGEHQAVLWLDVARYADTFGYQADRDSTVWPWRDWVIRAFSDNKPFDDFIREQIAGDLLPHPTQDQRLATAFNRLHRQTNEGGSVLEEFRSAYVGDRTETFATAFLGLTFNCARCHDHKFDPIAQKEYYQLSAFFSNIDESGMYSHFTSAIPSPSLFLYKDGEREHHEYLWSVINGGEVALDGAEQSADSAFQAWVADEGRAIPVPAPVVSLTLDTVAEGKTPDDAAEERFATLTREPALVSGPEGQAFLFDGDNGVQLKDKAAGFERYQPASFGVWLRMDAIAPRHVIFHRSKAAEDAASRGYELLLIDGKPTFSLCHFWPGNAIRVQATEPLPENTWTHCAVTYDGSSRADGVTVYVNGVAVSTEVIRDGLTKTILYEGEEDTPVELAMRFRDSGFKGGRLDGFKIFDRCLSALEVEAVSGRANLVAEVEGRLARGETEALRPYYVAAVDPVCDEARTSLRDGRKAESDLANSLPSIMTMEEMAEVRTTFILERGEYDKPKEAVSPGTPEHILPMAENLPRTRLGLAEWLVDPRNPLTARVAVNRFWQQFFGQGLVKTQEDFGTQGALPSNPALLDYLATKFVASGWDVDGLLREIVLSATYRQDSKASPDRLARDPENRLLARGPKARLTAEEIRDNALASAGLLVAKVGGPSVKPYQPAGLWSEASSNVYTPDTGEGLYRRSMYTFLKRTVPPPSMLSFNATGREVCLARRETTVTPLQALVLLNDPQYVEAARYLAATTIPGDDTELDGWIGGVFRRLTSRYPDGEEKRILREAFAVQRAEFEADPEGAKAYLATGETALPEGVDPVRLAAATALTQAIMNHEEFQVKQ